MILISVCSGFSREVHKYDVLFNKFTINYYYYYYYTDLNELVVKKNQIKDICFDTHFLDIWKETDMYNIKWGKKK